MYVRRLELVDFRSYERVGIDLEPGPNVLIGANGVGKKLAERIVTEFKGKPPPLGLFASGLSAIAAATPETVAASGARSAAISALVNLGYTPSDASRAVATAARDVGDAQLFELTQGHRAIPPPLLVPVHVRMLMGHRQQHIQRAVTGRRHRGIGAHGILYVERRVC